MKNAKQLDMVGGGCSVCAPLDSVVTDNVMLVGDAARMIDPMTGYISMIRSNALQKGIEKLAVIHGAANSWDLGYSSELTLIESMSDKFSYIPTILKPEKEPAGWHGDTRFIQDMWKEGIREILHNGGLY
jgi:hypothetical protein